MTCAAKALRSKIPLLYQAVQRYRAIERALWAVARDTTAAHSALPVGVFQAFEQAKQCNHSFQTSAECAR